MSEPRTRRLPPVTTAHKAWLACVQFFPRSTLAMDARLPVCTTRYTQQRQFVETDIQAWILGSKVSCRPHCSEKHAPGGRIVATIVRCLTGPLICLPRRLGRERPDHVPPYTHQQPYPRVYHPDLSPVPRLCFHPRALRPGIICRWDSAPSSAWCRESVDTLQGFAYDSILLS